VTARMMMLSASAPAQGRWTPHQARERPDGERAALQGEGGGSGRAATGGMAFAQPGPKTTEKRFSIREVFPERADPCSSSSPAARSGFGNMLAPGRPSCTEARPLLSKA